MLVTAVSLRPECLARSMRGNTVKSVTIESERLSVFTSIFKPSNRRIFYSSSSGTSSTRWSINFPLAKTSPPIKIFLTHKLYFKREGRKELDREDTHIRQYYDNSDELRASMPGRVPFAIYSSNAPPPVEIWVILS